MKSLSGMGRRHAAVGTAVVMGASLVAAAMVGGPAGASAAEPTAAGTVTTEQAISDAMKALKGSAPAFRGTAADSYEATSVVIDGDGTRHVHVNRTYNGLPVIGGDSIVHSAPNGAFREATVAQSAPITAGTAATVTKDKAISAANAAFKGTNATTTGTVLAIDAREGTPALAWHVTIRGVSADHNPSSLNVLVDAKTGAVRGQYDSVMTADTGTGHGVMTGDTKLGTSKNTAGQFVLKDTARGNNETLDANGQTDANDPVASKAKPITSATNVFGNGKNSNRASAGADAQAGIAATFDFYKTTFKRNGINNDGKGARSFVHIKDATGLPFWQNAAWSDSCFCMMYGEWEANKPLTALDVAGHEMTHGVTSATANLIYSGESGGLNEATSDILGTMVEFSAKNAADPGDFLIGEKIDINGDGSPLRFMDDPKKDGRSLSCWTTSTQNAEVHSSSGVGNHFFYLLSNGSGKSAFGNSPTCGGAPAVKGIGRDKAAAIWYRALTTKMVSTTNYSRARLATVLAADDLYGANSKESQTVKAAWTAVGVKRAS